METQDTPCTERQAQRHRKSTDTHKTHEEFRVCDAGNNWELSGLQCNSDHTFPLNTATKCHIYDLLEELQT